MFLFLSYAHEDGHVAAELTEQLATHNVAVWRDIDRLSLGDQLPMQIVEALDVAQAYLILISRCALQSRWVKLELSAAITRFATDPSFRIIPVVLDHCPLPSLLRSFYYLDADKYTPSE